jgi:hypothetical protein
MHKPQRGRCNGARPVDVLNGIRDDLWCNSLAGTSDCPPAFADKTSLGLPRQDRHLATILPRTFRIFGDGDTFFAIGCEYAEATHVSGLGNPNRLLDERDQKIVPKIRVLVTNPLFADDPLRALREHQVEQRRIIEATHFML